MGEDLAVSVLVATFRSPDSLGRVVAAVLAQLRPDDELIVVDDGSGDDTAARLARIVDPRLTTVVQENQGVSAARNRAARTAHNALLVLLDDDEVPMPGWLEAHRSSHGSNRRVVMGRAELVVPAGRRSKIIPLAPPGQDSNPPTLLVNDSFSVRRTDFEAVGGFDVRFVHGGEDIDLGLRLAAAGIELTVAPGAVIRHEIDRTYREFRRQRLRRGQASVLLEAKHGVALVVSPGRLASSAQRRSDRAWVAIAARSHVATELLCLALWIVVRVAGVLSSWRVQAAAAGRITRMLGVVGRAREARKPRI